MIKYYYVSVSKYKESLAPDYFLYYSFVIYNVPTLFRNKLIKFKGEWVDANEGIS